MEPLRLEIAVDPQPHEIEFLMQQIINFNTNRVGEGNYERLAIFLKDSSQNIMGGLAGETYWQWLYIDVLWIHESFRGKKYGDALLSAAEQAAVARGCHYAYLDTFSFQALAFYQKRGYVIFGELPDFPQGYTRFFLKKEFQNTL